ncbi:hypothetical protein FACS1894172_10150 [Spirochaetia bacterium]|nr:hypothetical protein FACS1894164_10250 [Spirochaetia bacterium]GHU32824.1 hypothetical protein FACS1894172_10150 [Spirochaetia bacterium]
MRKFCVNCHAYAASAQQKYVLVIRSGNYTTTTKLTNLVDDANEMGLGFR